MKEEVGQCLSPYNQKSEAGQEQRWNSVRCFRYLTEIGPPLMGPDLGSSFHANRAVMKMLHAT